MFKGLGVKPWRIPTWIWRIKEQDPERVDEIEQREEKQNSVLSEKAKERRVLQKNWP